MIFFFPCDLALLRLCPDETEGGCGREPSQQWKRAEERKWPVDQASTSLALTNDNQDIIFNLQ